MKKFLFDFFPVVLFFVAYKMYDDPTEGIITATGVAIVASVSQVGYSWFRYRTVERMHVITMLLIVVLGGLTIALKDEMFIKWKPTMVNWLFGLVFLGSQFLGAKPIVQRMMEKSIDLPRRVWTRLNLSWVLFFAALGLVNLYVVYNYDTDTWVNFKLFGMLGLTVLFVIAQGFYIMRHAEEPPEEPPSHPPGEPGKEAAIVPGAGTGNRTNPAGDLSDSSGARPDG